MRPLIAALVASCIALAIADLMLMIAPSPGAPVPTAAAIVVMVGLAGTLTGLIVAVVNLIIGHRPRIRRRR